MDKERTVIIREKSEGGALKMAAILAFVATSPFWFILGVVVIGCFTGIITNGGVWPFLVLFGLSLVPVVRDRLSGKYETRKLQERIAQLELEASEARLALLHLQETIDFDEKLKTQSQKPGASQLLETSVRRN